MLKADKYSTMATILKDTKEFYEKDTDRRAFIGESCVFTAKDDTHCAIGRYLKPEYQTTDWEYNIDESVGTLHNFDGYLVDSVKGLPLRFWIDLQIFHDSSENWFPVQGMTVLGKSSYNILERRLVDGQYDTKA